MKRDSLCFLAALAWPLLVFSPHARCAEWTLAVVQKAPPSALGESIAKTLQPQAIQLLQSGAPVMEFWFPTELALAKAHDASSKGLASLGSAGILGATVVHKDQRDYRDDELFAGTYTMRMGLRPNDGNHLGSSEYLFFAVLTPAKLDTAVDQIKTYKELVKTSSQESSADHPFILSLRPGTSDVGAFPRLNVPAEAHKSLLIKLPASFEGTTSSIVMDLVYEGVAEH